MPTYRGIAHIHSTFSADGEMTLDEIVAKLAKSGAQFLLLSEHAEDLSETARRAFIDECDAHNRNRRPGEPLLIAGLEFNHPDRTHVLGYGCAEFAGTTDPERTATAIQRAGGVAVLAHPHPDHAEKIAQIAPFVNGVEVWNSKWDGRVAPPTWRVAAIRSEFDRGFPITAWAGIDLHFRTQFTELFIEVDAQDLVREQILLSLRAGRFRLACGNVRIASDLGIDAATERRLRLAHAVFQPVMNAKRWAGRLAKRGGFRWPPMLKAALRKVL